MEPNTFELAFLNILTTTNVKMLKMLEFTSLIWEKCMNEFIMEIMQKLISLKGVYFWCTHISSLWIDVILYKQEMKLYLK